MCVVVVFRPLTLLMAALVLVFYVDAFLVGAPIPMALGFALVGVVVLVGFLHHADHGNVGQIGASTPLVSAAAALAVLFLGRGLSCPTVFSAAAVGVAGGLAELVSRNRWAGLGAAVYCGAFAGMTSERVLAHPGWVFLAGALAGLLLELLQSSWAGIGGKLGDIVADGKHVGGRLQHGDTQAVVAVERLPRLNQLLLQLAVQRIALVGTREFNRKHRAVGFGGE